MTAVQQKALIPPVKVSGMMHSGWAMQILETALELDIFSALASGGTNDEVAKKLSLDQRGCLVLLDALVGLDLLEKREGHYKLSETASIYLLPESKLYMGNYVRCQESIVRAWSSLAKTIKTGKPMMSVNEDKSAEDFFPALAAAIFPLSYSTAQMVAQELKAQDFKPGTRILDVACGSAVWSIPFAQMNKAIKVDGLDFGRVLDVAKQFTQRYEVATQYNFLEGNWREVKLEDAAYDLITLGHILHSEGQKPSEELLAKCFKALKPGGQVVIAEFMPNEDRTAPAFPLMFAVNMFVMTSDGKVFTGNELKEMLKKAGFKESRQPELPYWGTESPIMIGIK